MAFAGQLEAVRVRRSSRCGPSEQVGDHAVGLVADLFKVVPEMVEAMKKVKH